MRWRIGYGMHISYWFDSWSYLYPLYLIYPSVDHDHDVMYLFGNNLPAIDGEGDLCLWLDGTLGKFSSSAAWEMIRPRGDMVKGLCAKHSFICWMMAHQRLSTQD
ncbi:hypothetical protein Drorol1_Dr00009020, partial [Drosera rotundifolia]